MNILKYSKAIFPYYSVSAKIKNEELISTNALIYHALVNLHMGNNLQAKKITKLCIKNYKTEAKNKLKSNFNKHSDSYKNLHKIALLTQLFCSTENSFKNVKKFFNNILNKEYLELITNEKKFIREIKSLNLKNSWHDSNIIMAMFCLRFAYCKGNKKDSALNDCIDYLETIQNSDTGFWHSKNGFGGDLNAMAGTFHYLPLFLSIGREIPKSESIIKSTKKMHIKKGHFSAPKGHSCVDLDAFSIFFYCKFNKKNDYSNKTKFFSKEFINDLKNISNVDGGFSDFPSNYKLGELLTIIPIMISKLFFQKNVYTFLWNLKSIFRTFPYIKNKLKITSNSDQLCTSYIGESNIFSCWFKLINIDIASKINKKVTNSKKITIYKLPFIGYGI